MDRFHEEGLRRQIPPDGKPDSEEANVKRPRRSKPKVKTGCITCKIRRVKCDENKPDCYRCSSTGRKCDGYSVLGGSPNLSYGCTTTPSTTSLSSGALAIINPNFHTFGGDDETRCFEYFRTRTGPQLAGFFPSDFWSSLILRATFHEPVIKHAVLALGSLHERFANGDKSILNPIWNSGEGGFALTQYNQAIQHLVKPASRGQQAVDVCLIACMLFSSFETLRGHHGSALSHVSSGVKILSEVNANGDGKRSHSALTVSAHPYVELPTLEVFFNRLDAQISQMIGSRPMLLQNESSDKAPGFCAHIPAAFSTLEEARNSMDYHWNTCIHLLSDLEPHDTYEGVKLVEPELDASRASFSIIIRKWFVAFQAFLQKKGKTLDHKGLQAARTLEISQSFCAIYLEISTFDVLTDETGWDRFGQRYEHIVDLASLIVKSNACNNTTHQPGPEFSLDMNIVAPLYAVAHRCRHPVIRRRAVSLLYSAPRQEGIWDSVLTARVAERLIGIEEEGLGTITCAEDVPDWARISNVDVKFDLQGRLGTVSYSRQRSPLEKVREGVMETIRW